LDCQALRNAVVLDLEDVSFDIKMERIWLDRAGNNNLAQTTANAISGFRTNDASTTTEKGDTSPAMVKS
jgi:hypothetical protein